jgi:hypothetical protein
MDGYPGLDLVNKQGQVWSLKRYQAARPKSVTVASGGKAYFAIDYLAGGSQGDKEFQVAKIVMTPPNDTHQLTLTWEGAMPQDQSGATHPGTYVQPVVSQNPALG